MTKWTEKEYDVVIAKVNAKQWDNLTSKEWIYVSCRLDFYKLVNDKFINKYGKKINWAYFTWNCKLDSKTIKKYNKYFDATSWTNVTERFFAKQWKGYGFNEIDDYADQIDWRRLCHKAELTEDWMRTHADYLDWQMVSRWQKMTASFMEEYADKIDWTQVTSNRKVKTADLNKVQNKLEVSKKKFNNNIYTRKIDERTIDTNGDEINWKRLSMGKRKYSNEFLKQNFNKIKWYYYIREHQIDEEMLKLVLENKMITKAEVAEFKDFKGGYGVKECNRRKKFFNMIKNYKGLVKKLDEDRDYYNY